MRLMHGVEKQELMHHFLESAGRAGSRPTCRRPIRPQRRGAPRRRNKGWRGVKHHAQFAGGPSAPKGVVPRDEGIRVSGERSTTPTRRSAHPPLETWCPATKKQGLAGSEAPRPILPEAHPPLETWCPATKEQGLAGSEAPHPTCRRPIRPQRRGAP